MINKSGSKILKDLGDRIRGARESAKLTQAEVAKSVDVTVNYYARFERGEVTPSLALLIRVMEVLNIKSLTISLN